MKISSHPSMKATLMACGIAATLGLSACNRPDTQMSDRAAADAPKESATLGAALDDTTITAKIKQRMASDARVRDSVIDVETNNGVVTLTGSAQDGSAKSAAEELARTVEHVQGVDNQIVAPSTLNELSDKAENAAKEVGSDLSDAGITTKIKAQLAADSQVKATEISVSTENGVVSLKGSVASAGALDRARSIARKTNGVKRVDTDDLKIVKQS